jgi:hypothetical protein
MKFLVQAADDYYMTSKNYETVYGLRLYKHYDGGSNSSSDNEETNIYYLEIDSLFELHEFTNKTDNQKIIMQKNIDSYYIERVANVYALTAIFDGRIIIYNTWVE